MTQQIKVQAIFDYHSNLWPYCKAGDTKYMTYAELDRLLQDRGRGSFVPVISREELMAEVPDGKESETHEEIPGLQESPVADIPEDGRVKRTRRRNPGKQNKESVTVSEAQEPQVEEGKGKVEDAITEGNVQANN